MAVKEKEIWIRARCNQILKDRLTRYIEGEAERGRQVQESDLLRDLLVEFLDRVAPIASQRGGTPGRTPQEKASSSPPSNEAAILAAVVKEVEDAGESELSSPPSGVGGPAVPGEEPPRPSSPESKPRRPARGEGERKKT